MAINKNIHLPLTKAPKVSTNDFYWMKQWANYFISAYDIINFSYPVPYDELVELDLVSERTKNVMRFRLDTTTSAARCFRPENLWIRDKQTYLNGAAIRKEGYQVDGLNVFNPNYVGFIDEITAWVDVKRRNPHA